tara:strand:- start:488 stop:1549 length:1062 start_codon:yes stop_codon:yes gene_type:complete
MRVNQTGLIHLQEKKAFDGLTLFTPLWKNKTFLIDMSGKVVHEWELPGTPGGYARLIENGNLVYSANTGHKKGAPFSGGAQGGLLREVDWNGNIINEFFDPWQHHDFHKLENGNWIYAGWSIMPDEISCRITGGIEGSNRDEGIYNDYIREVTPSGEIVWQWNSQDLEIEKYPIFPLYPRHVYAWCNTVFPLPGGNVLTSLRHLNTIGIIDRETREFAWEMTDISFGGQHDPQLLENGNVLVFANGVNTHEMHPHSRVLEISTKTNEIIWEYKDNPKNYFYSHFISGQDRLPNGNTLICEGSNGRLFEVTISGEIVWEYINPHYGIAGDGDSVNWVFRALRYSHNSPQIMNRV